MSAAPIIAHLQEVLEDLTTGINAVALEVPRPDSVKAPPAACVLTQLETAWVARVDLPAEMITRQPMVLLRQAGEYEAPFLPEEPTPATIDISLIACVRDDKSHEGLLTCDHLIRAALRVLAIATNALGPVITRDRVDFEHTGRVIVLPPVATQETVLMYGVILSFQVHDLWALGA